ncbi:unnamed protein product [marine sediment metagenome]|uniref:Uncharacterized protein n=1 Tax=marine sediment metagenome TaxID=412755 RepID=X0WMC5_9ZZZZ
MQFYQFPDMRGAGTTAIWLGYYAKEWSFTGNTEFAVTHGLRGRPGHDPNLTGRLNPYCSVDSDMQIVNQMLKYYKFGFGFVTDEVCYLIREGRLSRGAAAKLVRQYDGRCGGRYTREFCEYIGISERVFWRVTNGWVNRELFERSTSWWKPKFEVGR